MSKIEGVTGPLMPLGGHYLGHLQKYGSLPTYFIHSPFISTSKSFTDMVQK